MLQSVIRVILSRPVLSLPTLLKKILRLFSRQRSIFGKDVGDCLTNRPAELALVGQSLSADPIRQQVFALECRVHPPEPLFALFNQPQYDV